MDVKKVVITAVGIGSTIASIVLMKNNKRPTVKVAPNVTDVIKEPIELFHGVSLEKINDLAKGMHHGINCYIDKWGFLVFNHKSNRGHQTFHVQMKVDETGKLINFGGHYAGQLWSTADEFAKRANELFSFNK